MRALRDVGAELAARAAANAPGGGEGLVDFSGDGLAIVDRATGESTTAVLLVLVLGASNYTYVEVDRKL